MSAAQDKYISKAGSNAQGTVGKAVLISRLVKTDTRDYPGFDTITEGEQVAIIQALKANKPVAFEGNVLVAGEGVLNPTEFAAYQAGLFPTRKAQPKTRKARTSYKAGSPEAKERGRKGAETRAQNANQRVIDMAMALINTLTPEQIASVQPEEVTEVTGEQATMDWLTEALNPSEVVAVR